MICKDCCRAADTPYGSTLVSIVDGKMRVEKVEHCKDEACACQHRTGLNKEEYLNG